MPIQLCPVTALLAYLVIRDQGKGPLFYFKDGRALICLCQVEAYDLRPQGYSGHSFRIRAATTAVACGVPAEAIMTQGYWKSQAYHLYVRLPSEQLIGVSRTITTCRLRASGQPHLARAEGQCQSLWSVRYSVFCFVFLFCLICRYRRWSCNLLKIMSDGEKIVKMSVCTKKDKYESMRH